MGIYNRDYFRDDDSPQQPGGFGNTGGAPWPVWQRLIVLTVLVFVAQIMLPRLTLWFIMSPEEVLGSGQVWRLLTYAFLHDPRQIFHILFNMLLLFVFGRRIESMYGSREFAWFYCVSAIFAALCYLAFGLYLGDLTGMLGASGAVMAVLILYALHFPYDKIYIWGILGIEMRWLALFIIVIDLHPVLLQLKGNTTSDQVAHMAHLGGAFFAWLYFSQKLRITRWTEQFSGWTRATRKPSLRRSKLKVYYEEPEDNWEEQVDRLLQKIQDEGEASLTEAERQTLKRASERFKNRKEPL
jgi:membrane associated rhomboid family serine protease